MKLVHQDYLGRSAKSTAYGVFAADAAASKYSLDSSRRQNLQVLQAAIIVSGISYPMLI